MVLIFSRMIVSAILSDMGLEAALVLADGSVFRGYSCGITGNVTGEVVFTTAVSGYEEILTSPGYEGKLVVFAYPHIGNVGCNREDEASPSVHATGIIVHKVSELASNFRAKETLRDYLRRHNVVGITGVDTRRLVRHLRQTGIQAGAFCVAADEKLTDGEIEKAKVAAQAFRSSTQVASSIATKEPFTWTEGTWGLTVGKDGQTGFKTAPEAKYRVAVLDLGVEKDTLRLLTQKGVSLTVYPMNASVSNIVATTPDGIFITEGAENPESAPAAIELAKAAVEKKIPLLGLGVGHEVVALALGATLKKMKLGAYGANHPVQEIATGVVSITTQSHALQIDETTLPRNVRVSHKSLFDGSAQALEGLDIPLVTFQGKVEESTDPHGIATQIDRFIALMAK